MRKKEREGGRGNHQVTATSKNPSQMSNGKTCIFKSYMYNNKINVNMYKMSFEHVIPIQNCCTVATGVIPVTEVLNKTDELSTSTSSSESGSVNTAATVTEYSMPGNNPDTNVWVMLASMTSSEVEGTSLTR